MCEREILVAYYQDCSRVTEISRHVLRSIKEGVTDAESTLKPDVKTSRLANPERLTKPKHMSTGLEEKHTEIKTLETLPENGTEHTMTVTHSC